LGRIFIAIMAKSKFIRSHKIIFVILILVGIICVFYFPEILSLSNDALYAVLDKLNFGPRETESFPQASGIILGIDNSITIMDWRDGSMHEYDLPPAIKYGGLILCPSHRGGLIFQARVAPNVGPSLLSYLSLKDSTSEKIKNANRTAIDIKYYCHWLDYDQISHTYLYSGKYKNKAGLFVLDTTFSIVHDITHLIPNHEKCKDAYSVRAIFADQNKILISFDRHIYKADFVTESVDEIAHGYVYRTSHNMQWALIEENGHPVLLNLRTYEKTPIEDAPSIRSAAFSPDDRYIAFTEFYSTLTCYSCNRLYAYNIETGELIKFDSRYEYINMEAPIIWLDYSK